MQLTRDPLALSSPCALIKRPVKASSSCRLFLKRAFRPYLSVMSSSTKTKYSCSVCWSRTSDTNTLAQTVTPSLRMYRISDDEVEISPARSFSRAASEADRFT